MKTCIIKQPAGLGDILFCQKIATKLQQQGYEITWPVLPSLLWIQEYIKGIDFIDITQTNYPFWHHTVPTDLGDNNIFVPLQTADQHYPEICMMDAKYKLCNLNMSDWANYLKFDRNVNREKQLFERYSLPQKYIVINKNYGTLPHSATCVHMESLSNSELPSIQLTPVEGFSLFDWLYIIENCEEFHTVDTSIMYIIESLQHIKCKLFCYSRFNPPDFRNVTHLFKKEWNYIN